MSQDFRKKHAVFYKTLTLYKSETKQAQNIGVEKIARIEADKEAKAAEIFRIQIAWITLVWVQATYIWSD